VPLTQLIAPACRDGATRSGPIRSWGRLNIPIVDAFVWCVCQFWASLAEACSLKVSRRSMGSCPPPHKCPIDRIAEGCNRRWIRQSHSCSRVAPYKMLHLLSHVFRMCFGSQGFGQIFMDGCRSSREMLTRSFARSLFSFAFLSSVASPLQQREKQIKLYFLLP
jgi:hypothetical protein